MRPHIMEPYEHLVCTMSHIKPGRQPGEPERHLQSFGAATVQKRTIFTHVR